MSELESSKKTVKQLKSDLARIDEQSRSLKNKSEILDKEIKQKQKELLKSKEQRKKGQENKEREKSDLHFFIAECKKNEKEFDKISQRTNKIIRERDQNVITKESIKELTEELIREFDKETKVVNENKKDIEKNMRERDLLNNDVVSAEVLARLKESESQTLDNQHKKLKNKYDGIAIECEKLKNIMTQLDNEKKKYGVEASQANAKYYQCLEKVKLKNNLITKLQKKNIEAEAKLKQQQNLYEVVR